MGWGGYRTDLDLARLQEFGKLANETDRQEAVFQLGAGDADVVGQAEAAFKTALGDAAMQEIARRFRLLALARDSQGILLEFDGDIILSEAGDS
jgi:hypothetical protein